ncbi:hypothetical protein DID76_00635 [Candidatus Marinamargulisbacteria bacterium SCGC AG-414-C22]|nr:hypothetical protein DID76_00635 [Candidatus Marinamargulisbacteria bacterium SCGC AG-414-C22]
MDSKKTNINTVFPVFNIDTNSPNSTPGFYFKELSKNYQPTAFIHQHQFWELIFIKSGKGIHTIDFSNYNIKDDTIFCLRPYQLHQITAQSSLEGYIIMFDQSFFLDIFKNQIDLTLFSTLGLRQLIFTAELKLHTKIFKSLLTSDKNNKKALISTYLKLLLLLLESQNTSSKPNPFPDLVHYFFNLIDHDVATYRFVNIIAKKLHVSPNYLNECLKKHTKHHAKHWIKQNLILESKKLLLHTTDSIDAIALKLLFPDATSFCRFFKKEQSISPHKWRHRQLALHLK